MGQKKQFYEMDKKKAASLKKVSTAMGKGLMWIPNHLMAFGALIFIVVLVFYLFFASHLGKIAGLAMGSFEGVTTGIKEGAKEGKEAGLSAEDVKVNIGTEIQAEGKLQVLLVDMVLSDIYKEGENYAALFSMKSEGVFTVDLSNAEAFLDESEDKIIIEIPEPQFELFPDDSEVKKLDEYQRPLFNGTTKDGYTGYLNSREEYPKRVEEEMGHNNAMMEQAKSTALQQVEALAKAICQNKSVEVRFFENENSDQN